MYRSGFSFRPEITQTKIELSLQTQRQLPYDEFRDPQDIKLFIYKFHDYFDGLIRLDLLTKWEAKIDLKDGYLITRTSSNPISMYNSCNVNLYEDIILAGTSKLIRIPINSPDGEVFVKEQLICNCVIHECLTTVNNSRGYLEVENSTPNDIILSLHRPTSAELFNIENTCTRHTTRLQEVLSRLRTDHLNYEEKNNQITLCSKYADVFLHRR